jgi:hypothetical protein
VGREGLEEGRKERRGRRKRVVLNLLTHFFVIEGNKLSY